MKGLVMKEKRSIQSAHRDYLFPFALLVSAAFLAICSKSSPLYPMNDWVDVHCYLTVGKGMLNGLIPYKDLYEQKGPVLYFIYAVVALFNEKSFWGQYLLEVFTFCLFLFYSAKIAELYLGKSIYRQLVITVLAYTVVSAKSFSHGGSVEQMCLFFFSYGLYTVLCACHNNRKLTFGEALSNGIFAGMAFWIKYTMVGFYFGLALFVLFWYMRNIRNYKILLQTIGQFLLGVCIVSAAVLVYFAIVGAISDLFTCYFYNNLFLYPSQSSESIFKMVLDKVDSALKYNLLVRFWIIIGFSFLLIYAKERTLDLIAVISSYFGLVFTTYLGKGYLYYALVLSAYTTFGMIAFWASIRFFFSYNTSGKYEAAVQGVKVRNMIIGAICLGVLVYAGKNNPNTYLLEYEKNDMPQYQFAEKMHTLKEEPTLLNFGFLDGGFYYAADIIPTCRFFCTFNVNAPGMWETQYSFIEEGKVDFVITRNNMLEQYNLDSSNYELLDSSSMYFEGVEFVYYLYGLCHSNV